MTSETLTRGGYAAVLTLIIFGSVAILFGAL